MKEGFLLREVINADLVGRMAQNIEAVWPEFDSAGFVQRVIPGLAALSFNDRSAAVATALHEFLPDDYPAAIDILVRSFGPELGKPELSGWDVLYYMPIGSYVASYGLNDFELSMSALYEITKRFSSESPIRPFLKQYPQATLARLRVWAHDDNLHVRRLVSEGTRPRLPLAGRLPGFQQDPSPVLALLEKLKFDSELYVRRSVANNLNDISKDNPDIVVETLTRWSERDDPDTRWLVKHALRTLLKQGHPGALALLGFAPEPEIRVENLRVRDRVVPVGAALEFAFEIVSTSESSQTLMVDYIIHYKKANGWLAPKVFKLKKVMLAAGDHMTLRARRSFKPINTRKFYPGEHRLELQINGKRFELLEFTLDM